MKRLADLFGPAALLAAVVTAVVGLVAGLSWDPDLADRVRDDAFYEFVWASNVAAGRGPMVSDGVTTSGVQLLWSLLLVPLAGLFGADALPRLAPWLGLGLHAAAALALLSHGWRRDRLAAGCIALCWLGNPLLVRESQNGQETALACLVLVLLWLGRSASEWRFGVLGVLATFARTDLFGIVALLALWRMRRRGLGAAVTPVVALASFAVANLTLGGGWLNDSAAPMAWLWHHNHAATEPTIAETLQRHWWYLRPVLLGGPWALVSALGIGVAVFALVRPWWPRRLRVVPAVAVGGAALLGADDLLVAGWAALGLVLLPAGSRRGVPLALLALFVGALGIVALHWAVRWYPRDYYLAPLVLVALAALWRYRRLRWLLLMFAIAQLVDRARVAPEPLAGQRAMALAGRQLAHALPAGERVGCFNSGIVTHEADVARAGSDQRRAVVNLDGVVDHRAFAALRSGQLGVWLDDQEIRFLLDNPVQFSTDPRLPHASGRWIAPDFAPGRDLVEVARFVVPPAADMRAGTDSMRLYWRRGRGLPPQRQTAARDLGRMFGGHCVLWPAAAGERLEIERSDGSRDVLLRVDVATAAFVWVAPARHGTGRLFVGGRADPLLVLPRL